MNALAILWIAICLLGLAVSLKSAAVLRRRSLWTLAGWLATAAYFAIAGVDAARGSRAVAHLDYVTLGLLTLCFVVAGIRDEPQAEPWWWPRGTGPTGAERRARKAP
jgi:hypothetical protein